MESPRVGTQKAFQGAADDQLGEEHQQEAQFPWLKGRA
jgi:hypothetical protein